MSVQKIIKRISAIFLSAALLGGAVFSMGEANAAMANTRIEAENYSSVSSSAIQKIGTANGGSGLGYISNGNYVAYNGVDFGSGATSFKALVSNGNSAAANIEVRVDSASGTLLGTLSVSSTGGWNNFQEKTCNISKVTGVKNLYLRFTGSVNIDWFTFAGSSTTTPPPTTTNKLVALAFDDGPDTVLTPRVLDKLDKYKAHATFMMIGQKVNDSTSAVVKRIVNSGNEIGNHSWGYSSMNTMSYADIQKSVNDTNTAIQKYSGTTPKFFRAPNLATSSTMFSAINLTFVQGVLSHDWEPGTTAQQRANYVISGVKDGSIVLMHDVQGLPHPTPEALDIIIPTLQSQGYEFVTLSQLFSRKGVALNPADNRVYDSVP
jgi:peptidoglycan/xylan/chitin deacetylase (PgdA/CDA1 family)